MDRPEIQSEFESDEPGNRASGVITDLSPMPSDPNYLRIRVEGRIVARVKSEFAHSLKLTVGQPWTDHLSDSVNKWLEGIKAHKAALNLLGTRAYSKVELERRLTRRGFGPEMVRLTIEDLQASGWIDDASYALQFAKELVTGKFAAQSLILEKLEQRGIDRETAQQATTEALRHVDPIESALSLAKKRLKSMSRITPEAQARRIAGVLGRRGFDDQVIAEVHDHLNLRNIETMEQYPD